MGFIDDIKSNAGFFAAKGIDFGKTITGTQNIDFVGGDVRNKLAPSAFPASKQGQVQGTQTSQTFNPSQAFANFVPGGGAAPTVGGGGGGGGGNNLAQIDATFRQNIRELEGLKSDVKGQAALSTKGVRSEFKRTIGDVGGLRDEASGEFDIAETRVGESERSALSQARRASGEIGQSNLAQLSALGISDSSAALALQERLGRDTFAALDSILRNKQIASDTISTNRSKVEGEFTRQIANLEEQENQAIEQINLSLNTALRKITESKSLASNEKAAARNDVTLQAQQAAAQASTSIQAANAKAQAGALAVQNAFAAFSAIMAGNISGEQFNSELGNIQNLAQNFGVQPNFANIFGSLSSGKIQGNFFRNITGDDDEEQGPF